MNTQMKFKIRTIIANSKIGEEQMGILESYTDTLTEADLAKLVVTFEKAPRAISAYADYLKKLKEENGPVSSEKLEQILTPLLSKLA